MTINRHVWLVTIGEPLIGPADSRAPLRTGRLAEYLLTAGWQVTWWTSGFDHLRKRPFSLVERKASGSTGVRMRWLDGRSYRRNISLPRLLNHRELARQFTADAPRESRPDVIVISFPPIELALAAVRYAESNRIPSLIDVRDLWPDVFEWAAPRWLRPAVRVASRPMRASAREIFSRAGAILAVSHDYLRWGVAHSGRPGTTFDRVIPIFGPPSHVGVALPRAKQSGVLTAVFAGTFGRSYDLETVVRAAELLPAEHAARIRIVLAGDGESRSKLERRAALLPHLSMPGWLDAAAMSTVMGTASVGLAAYASGALQSIPNKIVDYLSFGLPIVNGLTGESATMLHECGAGWNYRPGDASGLATLLSELAMRPDAVAAAAANAHALFSARFSPETSLSNYAALLEQMAENDG